MTAFEILEQGADDFADAVGGARSTISSTSPIFSTRRRSEQHRAPVLSYRPPAPAD
jgi:hypothetical protein